MKSLMIAGLLIVSLALTGNAAMAANSRVHTGTKPIHVTQPRGAARAVVRRPHAYMPGPMPSNIGRFIQGMLGGLPPQYAWIVQNAMRESVSHRSSGSSESSSSYDPGPSSSPSPDPPPQPAGPDTAGMNTSTNPTWPALQ